jgi:malate dehydrogenase (oxaloacetate-decarboxylating)
LAIAKLLISMEVGELILCDKFGLLYDGNPDMNPEQALVARQCNHNMVKGRLGDAIKGADVFIGVSAPGIVTPEMVKSMAQNAIVFPMANPTPEIMPDLALAAGARVVGTGRSDFPNQINNVLAFPGIFRGALDCRASCINEEMKVATSYALASLIPEDELSETNIIPSALDKRVARVVADAVIAAAKETGVARI